SMTDTLLKSSPMDEGRKYMCESEDWAIIDGIYDVDIREKVVIVGEMKELFVQMSDEKALNWLSAISPTRAYDFHKPRRLEGTCEWIFKTQRYQAWIDGTETRDLWVVGIPATSLIDELRGQEDSLTTYFFFRDGDLQTMSPLEMVASIIAQLINSEIDKERLMRILKLRVQSSSYFTSKLNESRDLGQLSATLLEMLQGFPMPVIILLDALDECTEPSSVVRHLLEPAKNPSSIVHLMSMPSLGEEIHVRFLLTGRPNVHDIFASLPYVSTIDMEVNEDIRKFVNEQVAGNESLRRHESQIIATIYENSQGMFRYAGMYELLEDSGEPLQLVLALVIEELNEPSPEPISKRLQAMPKGISGMYELILRRLGSRGGGWEHKLRQKLLLWVTLVNRPLKVPEMQYAYVTVEGDKSFDPDIVVLPTAKQMLAACGPLLEVTSEDELRFTHRTVKEFLLQPMDKLSELARSDERVTSCMVNEAEGNALITMGCGQGISLIAPD
ncbi:13690_t:CDS:2, partial [Acaulospora colombiana]